MFSQRNTGREPCSSDIKRAIRLPEGLFIVPPHSTAAPLTHHLLPTASLVLISVSECCHTTEARKNQMQLLQICLYLLQFHHTRSSLHTAKYTRAVWVSHLPSKYFLCQYHTVAELANDMFLWQTQWGSYVPNPAATEVNIRKQSFDLGSNGISWPHGVCNHVYYVLNKKKNHMEYLFFFLMVIFLNKLF